MKPEVLEKMKDSHYMEKCRNCGRVVRNCRCPGPKFLFKILCDSCKQVNDIKEDIDAVITCSKHQAIFDNTCGVCKTARILMEENQIRFDRRAPTEMPVLKLIRQELDKASAAWLQVLELRLRTMEKERDALIRASLDKQGAENIDYIHAEFDNVMEGIKDRTVATVNEAMDSETHEDRIKALIKDEVNDYHMELDNFKEHLNAVVKKQVKHEVELYKRADAAALAGAPYGDIIDLEKMIQKEVRKSSRGVGELISLVERKLKEQVENEVLKHRMLRSEELEKFIKDEVGKCVNLHTLPETKTIRFILQDLQASNIMQGVMDMTKKILTDAGIDFEIVGDSICINKELPVLEDYDENTIDIANNIYKGKKIIDMSIEELRYALKTQCINVFRLLQKLDATSKPPPPPEMPEPTDDPC